MITEAPGQARPRPNPVSLPACLGIKEYHAVAESRESRATGPPDSAAARPERGRQRGAIGNDKPIILGYPFLTPPVPVLPEVRRAAGW